MGSPPLSAPLRSVRTRRLPATSDLSATLTYYPPGIVQASHAHDFTQISFLLAGASQEVIERREFDLEAGAVGCKPAGSAHADRFGPQGALIFAVAMREVPDRLDPDIAAWHRLPPTPAA